MPWTYKVSFLGFVCFSSASILTIFTARTARALEQGVLSGQCVFCNQLYHQGGLCSPGGEHVEMRARTVQQDSICWNRIEHDYSKKVSAPVLMPHMLLLLSCSFAPC